MVHVRLELDTWHDLVVWNGLWIDRHLLVALTLVKVYNELSLWPVLFLLPLLGVLVVEPHSRPLRLDSCHVLGLLLLLELLVEQLLPILHELTGLLDLLERRLGLIVLDLQFVLPVIQHLLHLLILLAYLVVAQFEVQVLRI